MQKKLRETRGGLPIVLLWSVIFFIVVVLCTFVIDWYYMTVKAEVVKDALTFSELSVYKNIDKSAIESGNIELTEEMKATFKSYLAKNLSLNEDLTSKQNSIIIGKVEIDDMKLYKKDAADKIYPDGSLIGYKPSLYVRIKYKIEPILKGILGNEKDVTTSAFVELR